MSITVKSVYGDDIRRFVVSSNSSFEDFVSQLRLAYVLGDARFSVRFLDDENELITVTTDAGFREALSLAESGFVKILKFQLTLLPPPSDVKNTSEEKNAVIKKSLIATSNTPVSEPAKPLQASALPFNSTRPTSASESPHHPQPQQQQPTPKQQAPKQQTPPSKMEVFRLLRALFTDSEVAKILPSVVQVFQSSLMHPTTSLQHVVEHIMGAFPLIKNHPSIVALSPWFPSFLPKLEPFRQSLCQMAANFPGLLQMLENNSFNLSNFFGGQSPWDEASQQGDDDPASPHTNYGPWTRAPFCGPSDVHLGVSCDSCGMRPIQGVRYKCSVCPNYDLCATCEANDVHPVEHPLIKTRAPPQPFVPSPHGMPQTPFAGHFAPPFGMPSFGPWGGLPFGAPPFGPGGFRGRGRCGRKWGAHGGPPSVHGGPPNGPPSGPPTPGLERSNSRSWRSATQQPLQAAFVRECNLQDRTEVSPSQTLVKTWELQNSGTLPWPAGTKLAFARGDLPCIENSFDVAGPVEPGKTVQVSAVVRTPAIPGRYRAFFKLEDNQNNRFGPRLWCDVTVVGPNSAPQVPEPDPQPLDSPEVEEAKEAQEEQSKSEAAQAFWDKEEAREKEEKAEKLRKEAEECVVIYAKPEEPASTPSSPAADPTVKYQTQLAELHSMGYTNDELNVYLLDQHQGNVENVCAWLLEQV